MDKFEIEKRELSEIRLDGESVFDGVLLHVIRDRVKVPSGGEATREVVRHVGAVGMIPITDDGRVVVERQFRYPLDEVITEIPAGKLDSKEEPRLEAAKRELREETGYEATEWIELGNMYPAAAYTDEVITLYLCRGLTLGERDLDEDEFINIELVPLEELVDAVMRGEIPDAKTQIGLLKAAKHLGV